LPSAITIIGKSYNQTSSVNLWGNNFYVRDEQDIRSLAIEIATLTKCQQRSKGLRIKFKISLKQFLGQE